MNKVKTIKTLSYISIVLVIAVSSTGLFYNSGGSPFFVECITGRQVEIFGNGVYKHESSFKAPINKGSDAVILCLVAPLFTVSIFFNKTFLSPKEFIPYVSVFAITSLFALILNLKALKSFKEDGRQPWPAS